MGPDEAAPRHRLQGSPGSPANRPVAGGRRRWLRRVAWARRVGRVGRELPRPRATPFTFWYIVVLLGSTAVLMLAPSQVARRLLTWSSTDVGHLFSSPLRVLVSSALWLPSLDWLLYAALFSLVLAPVERRVGSRWTAAVFASGHVIATLLTELPIAWAVGRGYLPHRARHRLDVGVSYGFYAVLGVFVGLLPRRVRMPAALAAVAAVVGRLAVSTDLLSSVGHVVALAVGFGWWPWLVRRVPAGVRSTSTRRRA